jgi:NAD-dependent dihydropyrimidine dehydrogenase PreA subunit
MGIVQVDTEDCLGCGACVEACPAGLIDLVDGKAVIETQGCDACLSCVEACPSGALRVVEAPQLAALGSITTQGLPAASTARQEEPGELGRWAAAALGLFTQEFAPRFAEAHVRALDRRRSAPGRTKRAESMAIEIAPPWVGGTRRRRWRRRGGVSRAAAGAARTRCAR